MHVAAVLGIVNLAGPANAWSKDWLVDLNAHDGTNSRTIQAALDAAEPGDTIRVAPGTYPESLATVRGGLSGRPIRLVASRGRGSVVVQRRGQVLRVEHPNVIVEGLVFDGDYGAADTIRVGAGATAFVLRDCEVRRSSRDLIDLAGASGTLIERCSIHHALNAAGGRTDAHGVAAGPVRDLTIRDTEIHTFSGDGLQIDPTRAAQGWSNVLVEGVRFWLAPLPRPENGFPPGTVPGENAIDTKTNSSERAVLVLRDVIAHGFRAGLIENLAAFNLKEQVDVTADRVTVSDSTIAFRIRGGAGASIGARVLVTNTVLHDVDFAVRYEDDARDLRVWNSTFGARVGRAFYPVGVLSQPPDVRNALFLGSKPMAAADSSNIAVDATSFVDVRLHDYALTARSPAIDRAIPLQDVIHDRAGSARPAGPRPDVGAYEHQASNGTGPLRPVVR